MRDQMRRTPPDRAGRLPAPRAVLVPRSRLDYASTAFMLAPLDRLWPTAEERWPLSGLAGLRYFAGWAASLWLLPENVRTQVFTRSNHKYTVARMKRHTPYRGDRRIRSEQVRRGPWSELKIDERV